MPIGDQSTCRRPLRGPGACEAARALQDWMDAGQTSCPPGIATAGAGHSRRRPRCAGAGGGPGCWPRLPCSRPRLAALAFAYFAWPRGAVGFTATGLPQVHAPRFGATLARVSVRTAAGAAVPVRRGRQGVLRPVRPVVPGTRARRGSGLPPPGLGGLDRREDADGAGRGDGAAGAKLVAALAPREGGRAGAGEVRPAGARGRGDRARRAAACAACAARRGTSRSAGSEPRARSASARSRSRGSGCRPRRASPGSRPERQPMVLVSPKPGVQLARTRSSGCASPRRCARCCTGGCRRSTRPSPAAGGRSTRARSCSLPAGTASGSTRSRCS